MIIQNFGKLICFSIKSLFFLNWEEQTYSKSFKTWQRLHKTSHRIKHMQVTDMTVAFLEGDINNCHQLTVI